MEEEPPEIEGPTDGLSDDLSDDLRFETTVDSEGIPLPEENF
jgi:hypothetical protein